MMTVKDIEEWKALEKPTIKQIEEWQAGLNGTTAYDIISKPKHYMLFEDKGIEVRDVLEKLCDKLQNTLPYPGNSSLFESDYVQLMQYLMRFMDKNGVEDLKKARWYLDKMISAY